MEPSKPKEQAIPQEPHQNPPLKDCPTLENPRKDSGQGRDQAEEDKEVKSPNAAGAVGLASSLPPVSDLQKKFRRAERFGMPLQLSEEEKRNSRAERFGMGSPVPGLEETKKSEEQKRKARAERFGLTAHSVDDEEAKKKARLARFAPNSKPDTLEEDKRKARAIRFSQNSRINSAQTNGMSVDHVANSAQTNGMSNEQVTNSAQTNGMSNV